MLGYIQYMMFTVCFVDFWFLLRMYCKALWSNNVVLDVLFDLTFKTIPANMSLI